MHGPQASSSGQEVYAASFQFTGAGAGQGEASAAFLDELVNQRKIVPYVYKTVPFEQINEALGLLRDGKTKGRVVLLFPED